VPDGAATGGTTDDRTATTAGPVATTTGPAGTRAGVGTTSGAPWPAGAYVERGRTGAASRLTGTSTVDELANAGALVEVGPALDEGNAADELATECGTTAATSASTPPTVAPTSTTRPRRRAAMPIETFHELRRCAVTSSGIRVHPALSSKH
jgi:hypothetical protein